MYRSAGLSGTLIDTWPSHTDQLTPGGMTSRTQYAAVHITAKMWKERAHVSAARGVARRWKRRRRYNEPISSRLHQRQYWWSQKCVAGGATDLGAATPQCPLNVRPTWLTSTGPHRGLVDKAGSGGRRMIQIDGSQPGWAGTDDELDVFHSPAVANNLLHHPASIHPYQRCRCCYTDKIYINNGENTYGGGAWFCQIAAGTNLQLA